MHTLPSLLWLHAPLGLSVDTLALLLLLSGLCLSALLTLFSPARVWCPKLLFLALWALYLSLVQAGQSFLSFQWDILLLEAGALAVLYAPLSGGTTGKVRREVCFLFVRSCCSRRWRSVLCCEHVLLSLY